ncbi:MAG: hypothetical protein LBP59_04460 [Planctomycetaceae bacterium]|nr:hypothetical protein [Planctomycetaceae bacterium]
MHYWENRSIIRCFSIQIVFEFHRFKIVKACRLKSRQTKVNENSNANSLKF